MEYQTRELLPGMCSVLQLFPRVKDATAKYQYSRGKSRNSKML